MTGASVPCDPAHAGAECKSMILADTGFEFGWSGHASSLIDEVRTPGLSGLSDTVNWKPDNVLPAYDKQYMRGWLLRQDRDRDGESAGT